MTQFSNYKSLGDTEDFLVLSLKMSNIVRTSHMEYLKS